jgi:hypothetical protein
MHDAQQWRSPVDRFRHGEDRIPGEPSRVGWSGLTMALAKIRKDLDRREYNGPYETYPGYFTVRVRISTRYDRDVDEIRWMLLADGWNHVTTAEEENERKMVVELSALYVPVLVITDAGERFAPEITPEEPVTATMERIARDGVWHYDVTGAREFVPPHRIVSVVQAAPVGFYGTEAP